MPLATSASSIEQALVALLLIAAAVAIVARRAGVPYTIGLVLVGLAVGLVTHVDAVTLSSDLVFYVFLPVLLFEAAFELEARHLMTDWRRVLVLAVPGVLVAFALTALGVHLAGGMAWGVALLFGALISATDPVSVIALFRRLGVPSRLTTLVDAESLFNDGTAAVLFAIVLAAVADGADVGAGRAVVPLRVDGRRRPRRRPGRRLRRLARAALPRRPPHRDHRVDHRRLRLVPARQPLGMSGVVACVAAGLVVGSYGRRRSMSPVTRVTMGTVWEYAAFVANSLIFLLIGLRIDLHGVVEHAGLVVMAFVVVVAARAVTIYGFGAFSRLAGRACPGLAARAGVGRPARHHRPRPGAHRAGGRARPRHRCRWSRSASCCSRWSARASPCRGWSGA